MKFGCQHNYHKGQAAHIQTESRSRWPAVSSVIIPLLSLGYQRLEIEINIDCCISWPGLPEPPSLRSKQKEHSHNSQALPARQTSPSQTGGLQDTMLTKPVHYDFCVGDPVVAS